MLSGLSSAVGIASGLIAVGAAVTSVVTGGEFLLVLWSIGWVGSFILVGSFWLMLPAEGIRRAVASRRQHGFLSGDVTWMIGAVLAFAAGAALVPTVLSDAKAKRQAEHGFGFFHSIGIVTSLATIITGWVIYRRAYHRRYKQCPECISTVRREARKCRYCQHVFATDAPVDSLPQP